MDHIEQVKHAINDLLNSTNGTREIARQSGINQGTISKIRTRKINIKNVKLETIEKLYKTTLNDNNNVEK